MRARIYQPARTAMQSGTARTKGWTLDFMAESGREIDPLMGWTSSGDTQSQVRLTFDSREAAEDYARERGIDYVVTDPKPRKPNIRPRGFQGHGRPDQRSAGTNGTDETINPAIKIAQDFRAGGLDMGLTVGHVVELVRPDRAIGFGSRQLFRKTTGDPNKIVRVGIRRWGNLDQGCTASLERELLLFALAVGDDDDRA